MVCQCFGDPHCITFSGFACDAMGLGVFPMVDLPNVRVESFHCPVLTGGDIGASTIAGLAMRVGSDTIVVRGDNVRDESAHLHWTLSLTLQVGTPQCR